MDQPSIQDNCGSSLYNSAIQSFSGSKELLIAFCDLTNYTRIARAKDDCEVFNLLAEFAEITGEVIERAGGIAVKFIGDAALIAFRAEDSDLGVTALLELKERVDNWLRGQSINSRLHVKIHLGQVMCGLLGTKSGRRFDVIGETVNIAATLECHGVSLTPQAFRSLSSDLRKRFKKHTPPIRYIGAAEHRRD